MSDRVQPCQPSTEQKLILMRQLWSHEPLSADCTNLHGEWPADRGRRTWSPVCGAVEWPPSTGVCALNIAIWPCGGRRAGNNAARPCWDRLARVAARSLSSRPTPLGADVTRSAATLGRHRTRNRTVLIRSQALCCLRCTIYERRS